MPRRLLTVSLVMVAVALLLAGAGCKEKGVAINEKVTKANADSIKVDKTKLSEAEQLLGPGVDYSDPNLAAGLKGKKWGPGKDREEIKVIYQPNGLIVSLEFIQWSPAK